MSTLERQAKLVEALAGSITDRSWADDVLTKVGQMRQALDEIEKEARRRAAGER